MCHCSNMGVEQIPNKSQHTINSARIRTPYLLIMSSVLFQQAIPNNYVWLTIFLNWALFEDHPKYLPKVVLKKGWPLGRGSLTWKYEGQSWQTFSRLKCNKSDFKHNIWILSVMHTFGWANRSHTHNNVHTDITDREANAAYIMPRPSEDSILHRYLSVMFHSDHLLLCNDVRVSGSFCWRPRAHFHQPSPSVWQQRTNWRTETTTHQEVTH